MFKQKYRQKSKIKEMKKTNKEKRFASIRFARLEGELKTSVPKVPQSLEVAGRHIVRRDDPN